MKRSLNSELIQRINEAFSLLQQEIPSSLVVTHLMRKFQVSRVQAYRYVKQARQEKEYLSVPETSEVFTVKLPPSLTQGVRDFASSKGVSISKVVSTALEDFLDKGDGNQH